jgi:RES domain-containing protein
MRVFRIVKDKARASDLSGTGSYLFGGRWNSKGTYMLYTSENSSLAYLENLVHFDKLTYPPHLFIVEMNVDNAMPLFTLPDAAYPLKWRQLDLFANKALGDTWMKVKKYAGVRVRSAINTQEYNLLLNPQSIHFSDLVKIISINEILADDRLFR